MKLCAITRAKTAWVKYGALRPFEQDLLLHLENGYVISTPDAFVMARPVEIGAKEREIADLTHQFEKPNCWFVWSAAGRLRELVKLLPFPLPYVAFHRAKNHYNRTPGRMRIVKLETLQRRILS